MVLKIIAFEQTNSPALGEKGLALFLQDPDTNRLHNIVGIFNLSELDFNCERWLDYVDSNFFCSAALLSTEIILPFLLSDIRWQKKILSLDFLCLLTQSVME